MTNDKNTQSTENSFLNQIIKEKIPVTVFLINGVKLQGMVTEIDEKVLILKRDGLSQLVFKQAISTIMPSIPVE